MVSGGDSADHVLLYCCTMYHVPLCCCVAVQCTTCLCAAVLLYNVSMYHVPLFFHTAIPQSWVSRWKGWRMRRRAAWTGARAAAAAMRAMRRCRRQGKQVEACSWGLEGRLRSVALALAVATQHLPPSQGLGKGRRGGAWAPPRPRLQVHGVRSAAWRGVACRVLSVLGTMGLGVLGTINGLGFRCAQWVGV